MSGLNNLENVPLTGCLSMFGHQNIKSFLVLCPWTFQLPFQCLKAHSSKTARS